MEHLTLTGGVFFALILNCLHSKIKVTECNLLLNLIWTIYPDKRHLDSFHFDKNITQKTSRYKSCKINDVTNTVRSIESYKGKDSGTDGYIRTELLGRYNEYLDRMECFVHQYLSSLDKNGVKTLVCYLLDLIDRDDRIADNYSFHISSSATVTAPKSQLLQMSNVDLVPFLAGVWMFAFLRNELKNTSGKETYDKCCISIEGGERTFRPETIYLGKGYYDQIEVRYDTCPVLRNKLPFAINEPKSSRTLNPSHIPSTKIDTVHSSGRVVDQKQAKTTTDVGNYADSSEINNINDQIKVIDSTLLPDEQSIYYTLDDTPYSSRLWLDSLFQDTQDEPILFLFGAPGCGKSRFMAHLIEESQADCTLYYFCQFSDGEDADNYAKRIVMTLADQLAVINETFCNTLFEYIEQDIAENARMALPYVAAHSRLQHKTLMDLISLFLTCLSGVNENITVYIDALDEAERDGKNPIVKLLHDHFKRLPLRLVISCRPQPLLISLSDRLGAKSVSLSEADHAEEINLDIEFYITGFCKDNRIELNEWHKKTIIQKASGNFYYAQLVLDALRAHSIQQIDLDSLPIGLEGLLNRLFDRIQDHPRYLDSAYLPLMLLLAMKGSADTVLFKKILEQSPHIFDLNTFLNIMDGIVVRADEKLVFYHKSMYDWLTTSDKVEMDAGVTLYFEYCYKQYCLMSKSNKFIHKYYSNPRFYPLLRTIYFAAHEYLSKFKGQDYDLDVHEHCQAASLMLQSIPFLCALQIAAFYASDLDFVQDIANIIREIKPSEKDFERCIRSALNRFELYDLQNERQKCFDVLVEIRERYGEIIESYPSVYIDYCLDQIWDLKMRGQNEEAFRTSEVLYNYLLETETLNEDSESVMMLHYFRGTILYNQAQWSNAQRELELCLTAQCPNRAILAFAENMLGWCCFKQKKYTEECSHFEESLQIRRELYGESSRYTATALDAHARGVLHSWNKHSDESAMHKALRESEKAKEIFERIFGSTSPQVARCLDTQALLYCELELFEEAENKCDESLLIRRSYLEHHRDDTSAKKDYASTLEYAGRIYSRHYCFAIQKLAQKPVEESNGIQTKARNYYKECLGILEKLYSEENSTVLKIKQELKLLQPKM